MKRIAFQLVLLLSTAAFGQSDTSSLLPVEVRAVRASATAPFAKTNLSQKDIEKQNLGQDLPFLLNQTPSVVINSDAGNGVGYTGIRIRGTDASRINVTLNGIPYNDAESQGTFFVDLPDFASSVHSIQIQRGVGTSTNGAGAFGATINFSTNEVNKTSYLELNNSYGSFNTWKNTLKAGTGLLNGHFTADLRLSRVSSDGYIERAKTGLRSLYFSTAYLSDKNDLRLNLFSGNEKTYQAWNGVSEADLATNRRINYAGTEKPGTPYPDETDNYRQDHYQLFFTHRFRPALSFNTAVFLTHGTGYYEQYKADEAYSDYHLRYQVRNPDTLFSTDLVRRLWLRNNFYGTIFSLQKTGKGQVLTFGGSLTRYDGNHFGRVIWAENGISGNPEWYRLKAYKTDGNVYAKWQQDLTPILQFFADLQYRNVSYRLNGFRDNPSLSIDKDYGFINPKIGLTIHSSTITAYASFSRAAKEPNRDDFEAGKTQLPLPEKLNDWEVGLERKTSKSFLSANFYYMKYRDQLVLTGRINDVGAYTRTNIPNSYRLGIELQATSRPLSWMTAGANLTLSRNRILDFTEYIDDYDNGNQQTKFYRQADISFSPDVIASAQVSVLPVKALELSLMGKYVGEQFLDNTSNPGRKLDSYFTQDLRAAYHLSRGRLKSADLIFQLNNVWNEMYEPNGYTFSYYSSSQLTTENYYFPMAGRNWMLGLNVRF